MPGLRVNRPMGFTLVELLVALGIMALMAGLSWRGIDGMLGTHMRVHKRADALLTLQAGLAQWAADLDALMPLPQSPALDWDGRALRLTRRSTANASDGILVVAWSRRGQGGSGQWLRWQSPPLLSQDALQAAWLRAAQWAQNPGDEERRYEVAITALDEWKVFYFRDDAWTNPLSSDTFAPPTPEPPKAPETSTGKPEAKPAAASSQKLPEGIRLILTLPADGVLSGTITRDWILPTHGGGKS
ncbi:MAG: prepilin-type N-terminal cleavage/methylation domain-containing protein [Rhodoferax sp.]|nr:prepilin-type N-terminal cleavage/methylation domain-containing protein [Rhodoferax sp.]